MMKSYFQRIQMLRGVLFLLILAFHCNVPLAEFGWGGIEAFFVISAYFLVRKHWDENAISVSGQMRHRIARLYPPYLVVLLLATAYSFWKRKIPYDLIVHCIAGQNFLWMVTGYHSPMQLLTAHTWTLSIEIWLGLLWIVLLKVLHKNEFKKSMFLLICVAVVYRSTIILSGSDIYLLSLNPISHMDAFALGSLLAISTKERENNALLGWPMLYLGVVGIVASIIVLSVTNHVSVINGYRLLGTPGSYLTNLLSGNIYMFIQMVTVGFVSVYGLKENIKETKIKRFFTGIGNISYQLYLFHWPVLIVMSVLTIYWHINLPIVFVISMTAALMFNKMYTNIRKIIFRR